RGTRGGPSMASPAASTSMFGVSTDSRRRISVGVNAGGDRNAAGAYSRNFNVNVTYRPAASLEINTGPGFQRSHGLAQYVDTVVDAAASPTFGARYLFATLDQKELSLQTRVNYVLSPRMSVQIYMQPLLSVGDYGAFKELARPRTFDFVRYGIDRGSL